MWKNLFNLDLTWRIKHKKSWTIWLDCKPFWFHIFCKTCATFLPSLLTVRGNWWTVWSLTHELVSIWSSMDVRLKVLKPGKYANIQLKKTKTLLPDILLISVTMLLTFLLLFSDHFLPLGTLVIRWDQKHVALKCITNMVCEHEQECWRRVWGWK